MFKQRRNSEFVDAVEHAEHVAKPSNDEAKKSNVIWLDALHQQQQSNVPTNTQNPFPSSETELTISSKVSHNATILREYCKVLGEFEDEYVKVQKSKDRLTKKLSVLQSKSSTSALTGGCDESVSETQEMLFVLSIGAFIGWAATRMICIE
ncbi:hypothetical protein N9D57_03285 [bacterium]|nr:hypothetical protein [bacterium]